MKANSQKQRCLALRPNFRYNLGVFCAIGLILVVSPPNYFPN